MSSAGIFLFGLVVAIVATGAVASIWWAAVQDGRADKAIREGRPADIDETAGGRVRRPPA